MAAAYTSDGGRVDRPHVAAIGMADVSCCSTQVGHQEVFDRDRQVKRLDGGDALGQAKFIKSLFWVAA